MSGGRTSSIFASVASDDEHEQGPTQPPSSTLLVPAPVGGNDGRLSEFYEAYYRNEHYRTEHAFDRQSAMGDDDASPAATPTVFK